MAWPQHISVGPPVDGAIFLAQVVSFALIQIWRASQEELGGRPRPRRDIFHLFLTGLVVVLGLVLLIIWISHPIGLPHIGSQRSVLPVITFLMFIYVTLVIGITSSHRTSGVKSNPWFAALLLFTAGSLLVATVTLPMLIPTAYVPTRYQSLISSSIAIVGAVAWPFAVQRLKGRRHPVP